MKIYTIKEWAESDEFQLDSRVILVSDFERAKKDFIIRLKKRHLNNLDYAMVIDDFGDCFGR